MHQQTPTSAVKIWLSILVLVIIAAATGCTSLVLLYPEEIEKSNDRDIVVSTSTGNNYVLRSNQYTIDRDENGQKVIRGRGSVYGLRKSESKPFEGTIPVSTIVRIESTEKTQFYYTSVYVLIAAATVVVTFLLAFSNFSSI